MTQLHWQWDVSFLSAASSDATGLLSKLFQLSAPPLLWRYRFCPEKHPAEGCRGPTNTLDWSHDPEGTKYISLQTVSFTSVSLELKCIMGIPTQALHLTGQALLEEKAQLENNSVEEVTFDFSLKARGELKQPLSLTLIIYQTCKSFD